MSDETHKWSYVGKANICSSVIQLWNFLPVEVVDTESLHGSYSDGQSLEGKTP